MHLSIYLFIYCLSSLSIYLWFDTLPYTNAIWYFTIHQCVHECLMPVLGIDCPAATPSPTFSPAASRSPQRCKAGPTQWRDVRWLQLSCWCLSSSVHHHLNGTISHLTPGTSWINWVTCHAAHEPSLLPLETMQSWRFGDSLLQRVATCKSSSLMPSSIIGGADSPEDLPSIPVIPVILSFKCVTCQLVLDLEAQNHWEKAKTMEVWSCSPPCSVDMLLGRSRLKSKFYGWRTL